MVEWEWEMDWALVLAQELVKEMKEKLAEVVLQMVVLMPGFVLTMLGRWLIQVKKELAVLAAGNQIQLLIIISLLTILPISL